MDSAASLRGGRSGGDMNGRARPYAKNKSWVAGGSGSRSGSSTPRGGPGAEGRWERGVGHGTRGRGNGGGRGQTRIFPNASLVVNNAPMVDELQDDGPEEPDFIDQAEFETFYQQVDIPILLIDLQLTF